MQKVSWGLTLALALLAGILGYLVGNINTPEYRLSMYEKNSMNLGRADALFDLRYINAMIAHHRGAMLLAAEAKRSERTEIRDLAKAIEEGEPRLIDELYQWKKEWYGDERRVRDPITPRLGDVDKNFDLRFLNALIAHHEAGILMTQETRLKSSRSAILDNADAVEAFLVKTGGMLRDWRTEWYGLE